MRIVFAYLLLIVGLSSCVTQRRCNEKYPPLVMIRDSTIIKDSIITRHDTIWIAGSEIAIHDTIPCPELEYHKHVTKNHLTASVDIHRGNLTVDCKSDSLQHIIDVQSHLITTMTAHNETKVVTVKEYVTHWYDMMCRWWFGISIFLIMLFLLIHRYFPRDIFKR